jgi:CP family cyanate transporter-like MFS transporter
MHAYLFAATVVFAFNLRPAVVTVGPLLLEVQRSLALSPFAVGALTALPILALGAASAAAEQLGRRIGWGHGILVAALLIAGGTALRSTGTVAAAFVGALLLGLGMGLGAVFVPALLKARAPLRLGLAMGIYTLTLVGSALISVGVTPLLYRAFASDWHAALGIWAIPAAIAALAWVPLRRLDIPAVGAGVVRVAVWRSPLAWAIAGNMAMQSTLFYSLAAWLATLLIGRGVSAADAALDLSLFYLTQLLGAFGAPILLARSRRQGSLAASVAIVPGIAILAALYGPLAWIPASCLLLGLTLGALFAFALSFMVLRSREPHTAAALSGMAQTVGYLVATTGPLVLGFAHALPDPRPASALWMCALVLVAIVTAAIAGRPAFVDDANLRGSPGGQRREGQ